VESVRSMTATDTALPSEETGETEEPVLTDDKPVSPADKNVLEERVSGEESTDIIEQYNIQVSDTEVFTYVNQIASMNGYHPITLTEVNGRNPHWIYPGNVFELPDGEKFVVRKGDSLWTIAELKLTRLAIEFYTAVRKIEQAAVKGDSRPDELFQYAQDKAYNDNHREMLNRLDARFQAAAQDGN
ncbi:MAG: LysM peptidoglycan-binding domain-containing protein, partial [Spirochaetota bacterium]